MVPKCPKYAVSSPTSIMCCWMVGLYEWGIADSLPEPRDSTGLPVPTLTLAVPVQWVSGYAGLPLPKRPGGHRKKIRWTIGCKFDQHKHKRLLQMRESHPPSPPPQNKKTVMPSHPTFNWYWKLQDKQGSTSLKKRSLVYSPNAPDVHGFLQPCYSRNLSKHSWQKKHDFPA